MSLFSTAWGSNVLGRELKRARTLPCPSTAHGRAFCSTPGLGIACQVMKNPSQLLAHVDVSDCLRDRYGEVRGMRSLVAQLPEVVQNIADIPINHAGALEGRNGRNE